MVEKEASAKDLEAVAKFIKAKTKDFKTSNLNI